MSNAQSVHSQLFFPTSAYSPEQLARAASAIEQGCDPGSLDPWFMSQEQPNQAVHCISAAAA